MSKIITTFFFSLIALSLNGCQFNQIVIDTSTKITNQTSTFQLIRQDSERPIVNTAVEIFSDNGTRCDVAPCPTDSQDWRGTTDSSGKITVPKTILNTFTNLQVAQYQPTNINVTYPIIKLMPKDHIIFNPHTLQLIDGPSKTPIQAGIFLTASSQCEPPNCIGENIGDTDNAGKIIYDLDALKANTPYWIIAYSTYQYEPAPLVTNRTLEQIILQRKAIQIHL